MEKLSPGRKLILDMLAKSVAKIQAADAEREIKENDAKLDANKGKIKQESIEVGIKKKKFKAENETKENAVGHFHKKNKKVIKEEHKVNQKPEGVKSEHANEKKKKRLKKGNEYNEHEVQGRSEAVKNNVKKGIKCEYTEMKTEEIDFESYGGHEPKGDAFLCRSISNMGKNGNDKKEDNIDEPLKQRVKKEYLVTESDLAVEEKNSIPSNRYKYKERKGAAGTSRKRFSLEEDRIILDAIEKFGDKINRRQIAEDLQRTDKSILQEVRRLKAGKGMKRNQCRFTLLEDLMILDAVLKNLGEECLEVVNLTQSEWRKIGTQNGKGSDSSRNRWSRRLRPWILQHFAGTLNLEIRRTLANYVAENFTDANSIDWTSVTNKPEFAGHTNISLRYKFSHLSLKAKEKLHKNCEEITLEMVAEFANTKYAAGGRKVLNRDLKRQQEIIDHFVSFVETNCIKHFI